jgi:hypothetical protein
MGSATIRRFALVAAMLLLVPVWSQPPAADRALDRRGQALVSLAPGHGASLPAIRRQSAGSWWAAAARADHGRTMVALGLIGILSLLSLAPWAMVRAALVAPPPLGRRRHVISLRAPPLPVGS